MNHFFTAWANARFFLPVALFILSITLGCSTSNDPFVDPTAGYPREVTIEYRVTSTTENAIADVEYTNSTGGDTELDEQSLPYSVKISKMVEFAEILSLTASTEAPSVTLSILINDQEVESETSESTSSTFGVIFYQFGQ